MNVTRVYTGDDGQSHFDDIPIEMVDRQMLGKISQPWPATAMQFREVGADYELDFHTAPRRQLVVNLTGAVEIEVGSGEKRVLGPGTILLAEDVDGQGHISRNAGDGGRTCLFIHLGD